MSENGHEKPEKPGSDHENANLLMGTGAGLALFSAGTALATGVVCPLCVVGAPLLLGAGVVARLRGSRRTAPTDPPPDEAQ